MGLWDEKEREEREKEKREEERKKRKDERAQVLGTLIR